MAEQLTDALPMEDVILILKAQIKERDEQNATLLFELEKAKQELKTVKYLLHQHESNIRAQLN